MTMWFRVQSIRLFSTVLVAAGRLYIKTGVKALDTVAGLKLKLQRQRLLRLQIAFPFVEPHLP